MLKVYPNIYSTNNNYKLNTSSNKQIPQNFGNGIKMRLNSHEHPNWVTSQFKDNVERFYDNLNDFMMNVFPQTKHGYNFSFEHVINDGVRKIMTEVYTWGEPIGYEDGKIIYEKKLVERCYTAITSDGDELFRKLRVNYSNAATN